MPAEKNVEHVHALLEVILDPSSTPKELQKYNGELTEYLLDTMPLIEQPGQQVIRPLRQLAEEDEVQGEMARRTEVYTQVNEDSSTDSTKQFASSVEPPKRSILLTRYLLALNTLLRLRHTPLQLTILQTMSLLELIYQAATPSSLSKKKKGELPYGSLYALFLHIIMALLTTRVDNPLDEALELKLRQLMLTFLVNEQIQKILLPQSESTRDFFSLYSSDSLNEILIQNFAACASLTPLLAQIPWRVSLKTVHRLTQLDAGKNHPLISLWLLARCHQIQWPETSTPTQLTQQLFAYCAAYKEKMESLSTVYDNVWCLNFYSDLNRPLGKLAEDDVAKDFLPKKDQLFQQLQAVFNLDSSLTIQERLTQLEQNIPLIYARIVNPLSYCINIIQNSLNQKNEEQLKSTSTFLVLFSFFIRERTQKSWFDSILLCLLIRSFALFASVDRQFILEEIILGYTKFALGGKEAFFWQSLLNHCQSYLTEKNHGLSFSLFIDELKYRLLRKDFSKQVEIEELFYSRLFWISRILNFEQQHSSVPLLDRLSLLESKDLAMDNTHIPNKLLTLFISEISTKQDKSGFAADQLALVGFALVLAVRADDKLLRNDKVFQLCQEILTIGAVKNIQREVERTKSVLSQLKTEDPHIIERMKQLFHLPHLPSKQPPHSVPETCSSYTHVMQHLARSTPASTPMNEVKVDSCAGIITTEVCSIDSWPITTDAFKLVHQSIDLSDAPWFEQITKVAHVVAKHLIHSPTKLLIKRS